MGVSFEDLGKVYKDRGVGGLGGDIERKPALRGALPEHQDSYVRGRDRVVAGLMGRLIRASGERKRSGCGGT
jgi:hypothetical protein